MKKINLEILLALWLIAAMLAYHFDNKFLAIFFFIMAIGAFFDYRKTHRVKTPIQSVNKKQEFEFLIVNMGKDFLTLKRNSDSVHFPKKIDIKGKPWCLSYIDGNHATYILEKGK